MDYSCWNLNISGRRNCLLKIITLYLGYFWITCTQLYFDFLMCWSEKLYKNQWSLYFIKVEYVTKPIYSINKLDINSRIYDVKIVKVTCKLVIFGNVSWYYQTNQNRTKVRLLRSTCGGIAAKSVHTWARDEFKLIL